MKTLQIKVPEINEVEFSLEYFPEDIPVKGNASAIDEEADKETEDWIFDQLNRGNEWAWCRVKVTATWRGVEGEDHLGGCSYKSEKDFKEGGDFEDMKNEAYSRLVSNLEDLAK